MCKKPNYMVWEGEYQTSYKKIKELIDDDVDMLTKIPSDYRTKLITDGVIRPKFKFIGHQTYNRMMELSSPWIEVPCGQCLECRINQTRVWADRCVLEAKRYKYNYFVTLTYDDDHMPLNKDGVASLRPRDLQLFMKRLRSRFKGIPIRFMACGEYGDKSMRPHYHVILFNCPLNDLTFRFRMMENGVLVTRQKPESVDGLQYSKLIHECWDFQGMISVGSFNYDTAAYVSQYCCKKVNPKNKEMYEKLGIIPEFLRVSNRPGIGAFYADENIDAELYSFDHIIVAGKGQAHVSSVPRYFDKLFIKKYGDDIFNKLVRHSRYLNRCQNKLDYIHNSEDHDLLAERIDYHLNKIRQLKTAI